MDLLNYRGHFLQRTNSGVIPIHNPNGKNRFVKLAQAGTSDLTGIHRDNGRFIAIEVKIKPNKPTELQEQYLNEISKRGGIAIVAYSLEDVLQHKDLN